MRHHPGRRYRIAADTPGMLGHEIDAPVTKPVLLAEIANQTFAPPVYAPHFSAETQPIAGRTQPITEVVVVAVPEGFVEKTNSSKRFRPICGIARADVAGLASGNCGVALFEVERHRSCAF